MLKGQVSGLQEQQATSNNDNANLELFRYYHAKFLSSPTMFGHDATKSNLPSQPLPLLHARPSAKACQSGTTIEAVLASPTGMHASGKSPPETLGDLVSHGQTQAELHRHPVSLFHPRLQSLHEDLHTATPCHYREDHVNCGVMRLNGSTSTGGTGSIA